MQNRSLKEPLLAGRDLRDANALEGIDRDSKLLDAGEFFQHNKIRPDFYHLWFGPLEMPSDKARRMHG